MRPRGGTDTVEKGGEAEPRMRHAEVQLGLRGTGESIPNGVCVLYSRFASVESKEPSGGGRDDDEGLEALMKRTGKGPAKGM